MADLPRDPTERQKLALLSDLHQQLLSYRSARLARAPANADDGIVVPDALHAFYPDLPRHALAGKLLADVIVEEWIEPKVCQALVKLDPRKVKTATQAHMLQGALAYYFTYVRENLSASQILAEKLNSAQTICDIWCSITASKRFAVNKAIEELLVIKSQRTVQRYVAQGMATVFGVTAGAARQRQKVGLPAPPVARLDNQAAGAKPRTTTTPAGSETDIEGLLGTVDVQSMDAAGLNRVVSAIGDLRRAALSPQRFNRLAQFALDVPEATYVGSASFAQFVGNLVRYVPTSLEQRLDIAEMAERLRSHPVAQQQLNEEAHRQLDTTRGADLTAARRLCDELLYPARIGPADPAQQITQVVYRLRGRFDDADFAALIVETFDHLPESSQVVMVTQLLETCEPQAFDLVVSLAARPQGAFVRSRTLFLARATSGCTEHRACALARLTRISDQHRDGEPVTATVRNEATFLWDFVNASGLPVGEPLQSELANWTKLA
jgi:hypothetical protein